MAMALLSFKIFIREGEDLVWNCNLVLCEIYSVESEQGFSCTSLFVVDFHM